MKSKISLALSMLLALNVSFAGSQEAPAGINNFFNKLRQEQQQERQQKNKELKETAAILENGIIAMPGGSYSNDGCDALSFEIDGSGDPGRDSTVYIMKATCKTSNSGYSEASIKAKYSDFNQPIAVSNGGIYINYKVQTDSMGDESANSIDLGAAAKGMLKSCYNSTIDYTSKNKKVTCQLQP